MRKILCLLACLPFAAGTALAAPRVQAVDETGSGRTLSVAADGEVSVVFAGQGGLFQKDLYVVGQDGEAVLLFDGATARLGDTVSLGELTAGTDLMFFIRVENTGTDLFMGDGSLNPRGFANGRAMSMGSNMALVSFEDLNGGGDRNFADFGFSVTNADIARIDDLVLATPLPAAPLLLATGLAFGGLVRRRAR